MAIAKVVLVEDEKNPSTEFRAQLQKEGFEVAACAGGFDALDEIGSHGADIVVACTTLSDLSGYQLTSLIKSNDRTSRMPVILLAKGETSEQDEFWKVASSPDAIIDAETLNNDLKSICTQIKGLVSKAHESGWQPGMAKNLHVPTRSLSSANLINSYAGLLDDLLIERLVSKATRALSEVIDPRKKFVDAFFSLVNQVFSPDVLGIVVSGPDGAWAAFQMKQGLNQEAFDQLLGKIKSELQLTTELSLDLRGELPSENAGSKLNEIQILPVSAEKSGKGALIFGSLQENNFSASSKAFMSQLQVQMSPVMQLLMAKHEIEVLHEREASRAFIDPLTGLYNLEFLIGFLQQQLLFSFRQRLAVGMAIIDIDNFASINEEFGSEVGDVVLTTVANRLLNITRSSDLIARYGGDEFAVVLPNTDVAGAKILGEKVRSEIERLSFTKGQGARGPKVTVSVGCSFFNMEDMNPETILRDAKLALQQAKEGGRNQVAATN